MSLGTFYRAMSMHWAKTLAYKTNFLFLVIGPSVVFFFIKYNLWSSIYSVLGNNEIQGMSFIDMINYQAWVLIAVFLAESYNSMSLAEEIRMGRISTYMMLPMSFFKFQFSQFSAFQVIQYFVASISFTVFVSFGWLKAGGATEVFQLFVVTQLVALLWFNIQYCLGLVAFWLEETWVFRVVFLITAKFLSGAFMPLDLFPESLRRIIDFTPFPYMIYHPIKLVLGESLVSFTQISLILILWTICFLGLGHYIWSKGISKYTAAGM